MQEIAISTRVAAGDDEMFCAGMYCLSSGNYSEAYKCFSSITDERLRGTSRLCVAYYQLRNNDIAEFDKTIYSACLYDNLNSYTPSWPNESWLGVIIPTTSRMCMASSG